MKSITLIVTLPIKEMKRFLQKNRVRRFHRNAGGLLSAIEKFVWDETRTVAEIPQIRPVTR